MTVAELPITALGLAVQQRDEAALARLLPRTRFCVPTLASGEGAQPQIATDGGGRRALLAFTSLEALHAWGHARRAGVASAADLLGMAVAGGADVIIIDVSGPQPVAMPPTHWSELLEGVQRSDDGLRFVGDLVVTDAQPGDDWARAALARRSGLPRPLLFRRRHEGRGTTLTVGVSASDEAVPGEVAAELRASGNGARADVVELPVEVYSAIIERLPSALVAAARP